MYSPLTTRPKPVVLIILDGFGLAPPYPGNAVANANLLCFNRIYQAYPHCQLHASGGAVGLPHGVMGNSEVGHMNIGAGRIVYQTLPRINSAITNGSFYDNSTVMKALEHCKKNNSNFHIMGCASTGSVHSTVEHIYATLFLLQKHGFDGKKVFIHCFTDGRDTPPQTGKMFIEQIESECQRRGIGRIATLIGRYYAMDRNTKWDRIKKAYDLITEGKGEVATNAIQALEGWYAKGVTDEFIEPTVIKDSEGNIATVKEGDTLFFFNYRSDRAQQITKAFIVDDFVEFERKKINDLFFMGMTQYDRTINDKMNLVFEPENVVMPIGRVVSEYNLKQLRMAETEKFAHVTFFINGGRDLVFTNEDRVLVPSPKVATYDLKPEMSTFELTQVLINKLKMRIYDFVVLNIAAPDMVGHTGSYEATVKALQATDKCLDKIIVNTLAMGGAIIVTADHGNAEVMIDYESGEPDTEHSTNPVPFVYVGPGAKPIELPLGLLEDVSPTILNIMQLPVPSTMSGRNLLEGII
jgi:2,3-bisphosphoglycerate-independent phosphoglycerate mutase